MQIILDKVSKRFEREWIVKQLDLTLSQKEWTYVFTGPNGSGKSTLMQMIVGILPITKGKITYYNQEKEIPPENWYQYVSYVAPYQELIEEFTLRELLIFHQKFKNFQQDISHKHFAEKTYLTKSLQNKPIRFFSSGMKQRVKLGLAFYTESPIVFLDEPTSNLDKQGINWYLNEVETQLKNRLLLIASNQPEEYSFTKNILNLTKFS